MKSNSSKTSSFFRSLLFLGVAWFGLCLVMPSSAHAGYKILFYWTSQDPGSLSPSLLKAVTVLRNAGNTVTTIDTGSAAPYDPTNDDWSCASYDQIWDFRFDSTQTACGGSGSTTSIAYFSTKWQTKVTALLNNCGNFVAETDNAAFLGRDGGFTAFLTNIGATAASWSAGCAGPSDNDSGPAATANASTLPGSTFMFTDFPGGIPLSVLNGTSYVNEATNWSDVNVNRSLAQSWTGTQLGGLTSPVCQRGKLFMEWDMSMWLYNNYEGNPTAQAETQSFFAAIANFMGACGQCNCGSTPTNTNTNTVTPSNTQTSTKTVTNTETPTVTNTLTPTFTNSQTATPTNTFTVSNTETPTATVTNSQTPTNTTTPTVSNTFTVTNTDTILNTATNTVTDTYTVTATNTETLADTATNTFTVTVTNTYTVTNTNTSTNTVTVTNTATNTISSTYTNTQTNTPTLANTATNTNTNTSTFSPTNSQTQTNTATIPPTNTQTMTSTPTSGMAISKTVSENLVHPGDILTYTIGVTVTGNNLINPVVTDTLPSYMNFVSFGNIPSGTVTVFNSNTDLIQWTLPSPLSPGVYTLSYNTTLQSFAPGNTPLVNGAKLTTSNVPPVSTSVPVTVIGSFTVKVNVYNSAGEVVKSLTITSVTQPINNITLSTTNTITTLQGSGSSIEIIYGGIVIGTWDGTTNQGLPATNGTYKIQVDSVGTSGTVTSVSQNAIVNRSLANIEADVYNAAGELVRTLYYLVDDPVGSSMTNVTLNSSVLKPSTSTSPSNSNGAPNLAQVVITTSGTPVTLVWDGTSNTGAIVTPGEYTVQVHWNNGNGQTTNISRTILVVGGSTVNGMARAMPNLLPSNGSWWTTFDVSQVSGNAAGIKVRIYTIAGELIATPQASATNVAWSAQGYASGIYIANVETDNAAGGVVARQSIKLLIMH